MRAGVAKATVNQRRTVLLALALVIAALWITIPLGRWQVGVFLSAGVLLGLANHVLTELTLLRSVQSGDLVTRRQFGMTSLVRLLAISVLAIAITVIFWADGAATLFGLAIFQLIAIVFTGIPLLKEIKKV